MFPPKQLPPIFIYLTCNLLGPDLLVLTAWLGSGGWLDAEPLRRESCDNERSKCRWWFTWFTETSDSARKFWAGNLNARLTHDLLIHLQYLAASIWSKLLGTIERIHDPLLLFSIWVNGFDETLSIQGAGLNRRPWQSESGSLLNAGGEKKVIVYLQPVRENNICSVHPKMVFFRVGGKGSLKRVCLLILLPS